MRWQRCSTARGATPPTAPTAQAIAPGGSNLRNRDRAILVVDLAFGDCGKGAIVDSLARRFADEKPLVVRFNGGPQAGHNVIAPDGRHHTFSQFGSGTFVPEVCTFLSKLVLIEPYALMNEAAHLRQLGITDAFERLMIDPQCAVITPAHQAMNRLRELRRGPAGAHGTCGLGIGETVHDLIHRPRSILRASDLANNALVAARLRELCAVKLAEIDDDSLVLRDDRADAAVETLRKPSWIEAAIEIYAAVARNIELTDQSSAMLRGDFTMFEGAQGVLLDENFGFHPHTTWSNTTFANADRLLDEIGSGARRVRLGVVRSYFTRHGAGPFVTEDPKLNIPEPHNSDACWQGAFRRGYFDLVATRYSIGAAGGIDALAITHLDALPNLEGCICVGYEAPREVDRAWFDYSGGIVTNIAARPAATIEDRRALTRALFKCRPIYREVDPDPSASVEFIRRESGSPAVAITSCGPGASDHSFHTRILD